MNRLLFVIPIGIAIAMSVGESNLHAATIHDETINGDLSGMFGMPTSLAFAAGDNTIIGDLGNNGNTGSTNGLDADYLTFSLAAGQTLNTVTVDSRTGGGNRSFIGYTIGTSFGGQTGGDIDGSFLFSNGDGEILNSIAGGPLGPGDYSFWIQETASTPVGYQLTFNVTAIPEPSSLSALLLVGTGYVLRRRRR